MCGMGFALAAAVLFAQNMANYRYDHLTNASGQQLGSDFTAYVAAAAAAVGGQANLVYDPVRFNKFKQIATGPDGGLHFYAYPPIALLLSSPLAVLALLPLAVALVIGLALGMLAVLWLLQRLIGWRMALVAILGAPAGWYNLYVAQNNGYFTVSLLAGGLMALDRCPVCAGICFGCLGYKPQFGVLLPFALAAGRQWRTFLAAAVTVAVLTLASLAWFGASAWTGFFGSMALTEDFLDTSAFVSRFPTIFAAARELGATPILAYAVQAISSALVLAATIIVWRRPGKGEIKAATLAVAIFLATPYAWDYDTGILLFAAAWLGREGVRSGFLTWERFTIITLLTLPLLMFLFIRLCGLPVGPVMLWLALAVLVRRAFACQPAAKDVADAHNGDSLKGVGAQIPRREERRR